MTYIELVTKGGWTEKLPPFEDPWPLKHMNLAGFRVFVALTSDAEICLVEPEVVTRRFQFQVGAYIAVGQSVVVFDSDEVKDELTVDEDLREGKRLKV
jgi:hypothetical protein